MGRLRSNNLFLFLFLFLFSFLKAGFSSSASEYFRELGKKYYFKGDYQSAITEFTKAVLADSSDELSQEYLKLAKEKARKKVINNYLDYLETGREKITSPSPVEEEVFVEKSLERREERPEERIREEQPEKESPNIKVSGDYQLSFGFNSSDFIWKEANADKTGVPYEKSWRYLWGKDRYNTFDEGIYDRLRINLDINSEVEEGWGGFLQVVVDPWSFVGKTRVEVSSVPGNDRVKMDLKYWSGSGKTIDEVYRSDLGNIITVDEIKIVDGKTTPTTPAGLSDWSTNFNQITPTQIDRMYRFFRQCFIDYKGESFKFRFFPVAYQDEALTTDDPLILSNRHIWWEESPWLDDYEPSRVFTRAGNPLKKGRWQRRWSFVARDSDLQRLTFLRGFSFDWQGWDGLDTKFTIASPMNLWDEYERAHSLESALRVKYSFLDKHSLGFTQTTKMGLSGGTFEAKNFVYSLDYAYSLDEESSFYLQTAYSTTDIDEANGVETSYEGGAYSLGFKSIKEEEEKEVYRDEVWFAYLEDDFYPALSNYRYTCLDPFWSKHIRFEEVSPENQAIYLGDSINRGRYVVGLTFQRTISPDFDFLFNLRNAHQDNGKYLETVSRLETSYRVNPSFLLKTLFWYKDLPLTKAGYDPIITSDIVYSLTDYFSDRWEFVENSEVVDGKNPSVGHFSLGFKYDFTDYLSLEGVYERTNDPENFPRALLANTYVTDETIDGILYDKVVPLLYNQGFFDLPPYDYYSIVKGRFILKPNQNWRVIFKGARNTNKYSAGLDDNINHLGLELEYLPTEKMSLWFQYVYSKFIDLYRQVEGEGIHYDGHHNIFIGLRYKLDEDSILDFIFGETPAYDYEYYQGEWSLSSLDTQHLFRIYYKRKF